MVSYCSLFQGFPFCIAHFWWQTLVQVALTGLVNVTFWFTFECTISAKWIVGNALNPFLETLKKLPVLTKTGEVSSETTKRGKYWIWLRQNHRYKLLHEQWPVP